MVNQLTGLFFACFIATSAFAQIELGGEEDQSNKKKEEVVEVKEKREQDGATEIYFVTNWSHTSRKLEMNDAPFGKPLGEREFENPLNKWSFGIGFRNKINPFLTFQGGISYLRNGESYLFEDTDTLFKYTTTYSYIAMPLKVLFTYGNDVSFMAGGGLTPQLFQGYVQEQEWRDAVDATGDETIKAKNGYSSFALSAAFNIGVQLKFSDNWSLLFMPEYRIQLTDTYEKTDGLNHFGRALGFDLGLTLKL